MGSLRVGFRIHLVSMGNTLGLDPLMCLSCPITSPLFDYGFTLGSDPLKHLARNYERFSFKVYPVLPVAICS